MNLKSICFVLMCTSFTTFAQTQFKSAEKTNAEVTRHTVMERFDPQLILSAEERIKLKEDRVAEINRRRGILDTIDISERKREKLMRDILKDPFSPRLARTLAEIEFEDDKD